MRHKVRWWDSLSMLQRWTALVIVFLACLPAILAVYDHDDDLQVPHTEVEHWANKIGTHLFYLSNLFAQYDEIRDNFRGAKVQRNDGLQLVKEMAEDVTNMMKYKIEAVKRIMNVAEEASLDQFTDDDEVDYYSAKKLNEYYSEDDKKRPGQLKEGYRELKLVPNSHFDGIPVNENFSSVHVPTNVYDKAPDVLRAIRWSGRLDRTFKSNYELDPTLSWQYFGSSSGFLRQYPATKWVLDERDPDLYDARLRSWYIEAANSAKDMVILLDVSGSMTGLNREIAKHVVLNILETLNENDFVNVYNFNNGTKELVPCFHNTLVQANLENIGEFKKALSQGETKDIANFTLALTTAFDLLHRKLQYNKSGQGSQCNQAIMLVTDGAPNQFEEIFAKYNWPHLQVRVFTYLIGRQEAAVRNLKWMACANKGYFVHVTTLAEVREQVLKYIPVMARPMVMYQTNHPHVWTGVYADIANPVDVLTTIEIASRPDKVFRGRREAPGLRDGYRLMTSVSIPVFDRRKTMVRSANLLGVAGTDVPIREIEKLVPPYKLGVNGYSFMVNRNGYILYHPDLRPVHEEANAEFQDILKPNYNSVDFAEVELFDKEDDLRSNDSELLALTMGRDYNNKLRRDLIEQRAVETLQDVKVHLDGMKRVVTRGQWYYTQKVEDTPFSLGIALPEKYGRYKVFGQIELSRAIQDPRSNRAMDHFSSGNWTLHPEWVYCEYKYDDGHHNLTPEQLMTDFLSRAQKPHWKWRSTRTRPLPEPSLSHTSCDKDLIQSLLFDARATNVYFANKKMFEDSINGDRNSTKRHITGITTSFVATRSGLTRWFDIPKHNSSEDPKIQEGLPHFMQVHNRAIDEVWYKRAVDYYEQDPLAYVYSVPFDAATQDPGDVLVVATRAIFIEENNSKKAPAAVVGVTIKHSQFVEYFINETSKCPSYPSRDNGCKDGKTCSSPHLDCYLLDDNGFIIASDKKDSTGKFFGTIEGTIMESLVQSEVYKRVRILDYQAVCLDSDMEPSSSSILYTPVQMIKWSFNWIVGNIFWLMVKTHLYTLWDPNEAWAYTHVERDAQYPVVNEPSPDYPDHKEYSEPRVERAIPDYMADEATAIEEVVADYEPPDFSGDAAEDESESSGESSGEGSGSEPEEASGEPPVPEYDVMNVMDTYDTDVGSGSGDGDADPEAVLTEYDDILEEIYDDGFPDDSEPYEDYDNVEKSVAFPSLELAYINKTKPRPCDKEVNLYILQNNKLKQDGVYKPVKGKLSNCHANGCGRPFSVQKVKSTNLILVAVNNQCKCESRNVDIEPAEVDYNETMHCNRLLLSHFRRRPQNCYNYHPEETEIKLCGGAGSLGLPSLTMLISLVLAHMCYTLKLHS